MNEKAIEVITCVLTAAIGPRGVDWNRMRAESILAALKDAGIAVVELPDLVLDEMGAPTWAVEQHWCGRESSPGEVRIRVTDKRISATSVSNPNDCPGDARSLAAALLAAADMLDEAAPMTNPTPRTFPEQLDADFAGTLLGFMRAYDKARDEDEAKEAGDE